MDAALAHVRDYAIVLIDARHQIADWNDGAEHLLGYTREQVLGQHVDLLFTPEDRAAGVPMRELAGAAEQGVSNDDRWHLRCDGSRFFGSGIVTAIRDDSGTLLGFVKLFRDLTEQRRAQDRIAASEQRYRLLVESVKDYAIYMLGPDGRISQWTSAAERIKGYTAAEIVGQPFATFFTASDRAHGEPERELQAAREIGRTERCGWRVRKDGSLFWADEIITAVHDSTGALVGYAKVTRDSSERRRADIERERLLQQANDSNRLKDEFLSTVSHELRTPLNAVLGWMQLIRVRPPVPERLHEALGVVERNARTLARLIEDLLDVSRIASGTMRLTLEPVSLAGPLGAAVETVRPLAEHKGIELDIRHDLATDVLMADATRLQQVFGNLLANAVKFTPSGGRIAVSTLTTRDSIEVTVQDSGAGIDADFLPHVFERFRQADTGHRGNHAGLGLGLSIVKQLIELHGGDVVLTSDGPGRGTLARVRLPRRCEEQASDEHTAGASISSPAAARSGARLDGMSIVVVDDNDDSRRLLDLALTAQGAQVTLAASAADGLTAVHRWRSHVVLADLALPGQDGFALVRQLRAAQDDGVRRLPVVALSAHARADDVQHCLAAGFDAYLPKPLDMTKVVDLVLALTARGGDAGRHQSGEST